MRKYPHINGFTGKGQPLEPDKLAHVEKIIRRNKFGVFCILGLVIISVAAAFTTNDYVFLLAAFVWCLFFLRNALRLFQMRSSIDNWPTASGTVTRSEIAVSKGAKSGDPSYSPSVWYDYSVDQQEYTGYVISYGAQGYNAISEKSVAKVVSAYPLNSKVRVFYDPDRPGVGCLKKSKPFLSIFVCLLLCGLSGYAFYFILTENLGFHLM